MMKRLAALTAALILMAALCGCEKKDPARHSSDSGVREVIARP